MNSIPITSPVMKSKEKCKISHHNIITLHVATSYCMHVHVYRAQDEMVRVNQAYHDVLANSESRELYNQLCNFRTVSMIEKF